MNLHVLSTQPDDIPQFLDDKRIGKMLMEANQMLSLAVKHTMHYDVLEIGAGMLCSGLGHLNHPVSIWVRETNANYDFTLRYAEALAAEYEFRFDKSHISSKRTKFLREFYSGIPESDVLTPFQNSARHLSRFIDFTFYPVVEAYQRYMLVRWAGDFHAPKWTHRQDPRPAWESLYEDA